MPQYVFVASIQGWNPKALWSFALPALVSGALIAGGLVVLAAGSARSLAREAADYAIAGSP